VHGSGAEPEDGRVVEICWRNQPLWPPVDVADDSTTSPSMSKPVRTLTAPPPAAARKRRERVRDRLERGYVSTAAPPTYVAVAVGPITTTPFPAKSELRSGKRAVVVLQQRRALLGYVLRDGEVGRHQCLQVWTHRDEGRCSSPPRPCNRCSASRRAFPRAAARGFIEVRMWKMARSSVAAHSVPLTAGIGG